MGNKEYLLAIHRTIRPIVFFRVAGGELQRVIDIHDGLEEVQAIHVLQQILAGLSFLHNYKIAHLDLKVRDASFSFFVALISNFFFAVLFLISTADFVRIRVARRLRIVARTRTRARVPFRKCLLPRTRRAFSTRRFV